MHYASVSGLAEVYGGSHLYPHKAADFFTMEKSLESCTRSSCHNELFYVGFMRGLLTVYQNERLVEKNEHQENMFWFFVYVDKSGDVRYNIFCISVRM